MQKRFLLCTVFLLSSAFLDSKVHADDYNALVQSALKKSGENRQQLQTALENVPSQQREGMQFLIAYMPVRDLKKLTAKYLLENVAVAYKAWNESPWKNRIPKAEFLNNVLPYASINERRDNWRKDFYEKFSPLIKNVKSPAEATALLNQKIFPMLKVRYSTKRPKADQSPYESIDAGMASCTGLSVILVDACRAVGVPARFAGTPLWTNKSGNHSWVEIYDNGWHFTGAAEPTGNDVDRAWFAGRASTAKRNHRLHAIYATSYRKTPISFPLVWDRRLNDVYAINVTDRYTRKKKILPAGSVAIMFRVLEEKGGERKSVQLQLITGNGKVIFDGKTNDERFDANDHITVEVKQGNKYRVQISLGDLSLVKEIEPKKNDRLFTFYLNDAKSRKPKSDSAAPEETAFRNSNPGKSILELVTKYFDSAPEKRGEIAFSSQLDKFAISKSSTVRKMIWEAYTQGFESKHLKADFQANKVTYGKMTSPYVVKKVGKMPKNGWPLFIAMHGGGGVPKRINDSQWRQMQIYYRDQKSVEGYLYLALRAPNDVWNGFYAPYNLPLTANLIRQFLLFGHVDSDKVFLMGYSHGGYGAFYIGPQMADRFAAIHVSAAAPSTGNEIGKNLRNTRFTYMVGEKDTRYGRLSRCKSFDKYMTTIKTNTKDAYPVKFEYKAGYGHGGLPDRDKISEMYPFTRNPVPNKVVWLTTRGEVNSFNWLHVPHPGGGKEVTASCRNNQLVVKSKKTEEVHVLLDERLVDYSKPLLIELNGKKLEKKLKPSLQTMCETLSERGDPKFIFATRVVLKPEFVKEK